MKKIQFIFSIILLWTIFSCNILPPALGDCERAAWTGIEGLEDEMNKETIDCPTNPKPLCSSNIDFSEFETQSFTIFETPWSNGELNHQPYTIADQDAYIEQANTIGSQNVPTCANGDSKIMYSKRFSAGTQGNPVEKYLKVEITYACCSAKLPN